jgi:hypothetical protein
MGDLGPLLAGIMLIASGLIRLVILGPVALYLGGAATAEDYLLEMLLSIASVGMLVGIVGFCASPKTQNCLRSAFTPC